LVQTIGDASASVGRYVYLRASRAWGATDPKLRAIRVRPSDAEALLHLAVAARGRVYAVSEELQHDDLDLEAVDALYRLVGLRRYRKAFVVCQSGSDEPIAAAIAYRGPLGLNFSFLENRCDVLVRPGL